MYSPGSLFSCAELTTRPVAEPHFYDVINHYVNNSSILYSGGRFVMDLLFRHVELEDDNVESLKKIVHETVSDVLGFDSDTKLSTIGVSGPDGQLTPDFIDTKSKLVLEIATTLNPEPKSLTSSYDGKVVKYKKICVDHGYNLGVLVVSMNRVLTNLELTQDVVDNLCLRARIGMSFRSFITDKLGRDIFEDDLSDSEKRVRLTFKTIKPMPIQAKEFPIPTIMDSLEPITKEDVELCGKALNYAKAQARLKTTQTVADVKAYLDKFQDNCKTGMKRITNIPMVALMTPCVHARGLDPENAFGIPNYVRDIWLEAVKIKAEVLEYDMVLEEALGRKQFDRHRLQKAVAFNVSLSDSSKIEAAKTGLWGKEMAADEGVKKHRMNAKKSFHPLDTQTQDIQEFITTSLISEKTLTNVPPGIRKLIKETKALWNRGERSLGFDLWKSLLCTDLICFSQTISILMTEIAYCYKYWPKRADFYHKWVGGVHVLVRSTGTHIFTSFAFPTCCCKDLDTGNLGPGLYYSDSYIFTDFSSFNEPTLEHFVQSGPYMCSILAHLMTHYEVEPTIEAVRQSNEISQTVNGILIMFLNNKTDLEELITSQRYLTMGVMEELDPNPYKFVDRFPEVFRSRATCFFFKKTLKLMEWYSQTALKKLPTGSLEDSDVEIKGLKSIFVNSEVSLKQKINEFYFGYVISKERGRGGDRTFKIIKKILKEEYSFRDKVENVFSSSISPKTSVSNPIVIKVYMKLFSDYMNRNYGAEWRTLVSQHIVRSMAESSFQQLATLKVASRNYKESTQVPHTTEGMTSQQVKAVLEKINPEEKEKRPRVMEALILLVEDYIKWKGHEPKHLIDLVPFCHMMVMNKGYFDSDIFPKPQHGGDREIHVLHISIRICQFHVELISRTIARLIPCDTLTHPSLKDNLSKNHYRGATETLGDSYFTLCKSADATKWCQRNHSSKFALILMPLTPPSMQPFVLNILSLWVSKRISFPIEFSAVLLSQQKIKSNPVYNRFHSEYHTGVGVFTQPKSNKMWIKSGMMQGILHYTSTLTHAIVMIISSEIVEKYLKRKGIKCFITNAVGSDDSAMMLSIAGKPTKALVRLSTTMLHWKEKIAEYFSIYTNRAKSAIGIFDLVEYNSEWSLRGQTIKPTFRWVSACMTTTVVERFIDRVRSSYNILSTVLEGGGKVLECSIIQMCQAWMHYMMIGLHTSPLANSVAEGIFLSKDPAVGYYPLDSDFSAGIPGVDFQLYHLVKTTAFKRLRSEVHEPEFLVADETEDKTISQDLRSVRIRFGSLKIWDGMLRRLNAPELEKIVELVEANPRLVFQTYHDWERAKPQIYLKIFQPGVKESLSSYSPAIRMMAASAYLISKPSISLYTSSGITKISLYQLLNTPEYSTRGKERSTKDILRTYPYASEYDSMIDFISKIESSHSLSKTKFKTRSKQKVQVFEKYVDDVSVIDMCRRRWDMGGVVPLSTRQFYTYWAEMKKKYEFLKDTLEETKQELDVSTIELKNYLESLTTKAREITLLDTAAKSGSIRSAVTRIFWPSIKIQTSSSLAESESYDIRSKIFCILTFWSSNLWKKDAIEKLLKSSPTLAQEVVPPRLEKLKILRDRLVGVDKSTIIRRLERLRLGSLGYFPVRQEGFGQNRTGPGEWRGRCLGVPTIIKMQDLICTEIRLSTMQDRRELSKVLVELVRSFGLKWPTQPQESEYWLPEKGSIIWGRGNMSAIPVVIDPNVDIKFVDEISERMWDWEITTSKIRLLADIGADAKVTIMADDFSSRDWDPALMTGFDPLGLWSRGEQIPVNMIEEELCSAVKPEPVSLQKFFQGKTLLTKSGWDVRHFVAVLREFLEVGAPPQTPATELLDLNDYIDDDFFDDLVMGFTNLELDEDLLLEDESTDNDETEDLYEIDELTADELDLQLEIFETAPRSSLVDERVRWGMPMSNQVFLGVSILSKAQFGMSLKDVVEDFSRDRTKTAFGFMGVLLSLLCRRNCLHLRPTLLDMEIIRADLDSVSMVSTLKDEEGLAQLSVEDLQDNILFLEDTALRAPPQLKTMAISNLQRMQRLLMLKTTKNPSEELEEHTVVSWVDKASSTLLKMKDFEKFRTADISILTALLRLYLQQWVSDRQSRGEISAHEHSILNEAIQKPYLTSYFLDCAFGALGIGSKIAGYEVGSGSLIQL